MVSFVYFVLIVFLMAAKPGDAQNLKAGDACLLEESGDAGVCVSLKDCKSAKMGQKLGKRPQVCFYEAGEFIVCCNTPQGIHVNPVTSGANPASLGRSSRAAGSRLGTTCPDKPPKAVKVQKRGQKAWDKCIDLSDSVHPCVPSSNLYGAPDVRSYECAHSATPLVVGGTEAGKSEFPHMAAVGYGDPEVPANICWYCGGSLISELWVLTAAHCLNSVMGQHVSHVRLGGGDNNIAPEKENLFVVILPLKHPNYKRPSKYNDIALLQLNRRVSFSKDIRPICLHTGDPVDEEKAMVTGWGVTENRGSVTSNTLLKATVQKFTFEECGETYEKRSPTLTQGILNNTQTCYGHKTERHDTCQGDSGGPLQIHNSERVDCTYLLIGITSFGKVCGQPDIPAVYTRVSGFIPWIEETVWPDS